MADKNDSEPADLQNVGSQENIPYNGSIGFQSQPSTKESFGRHETRKRPPSSNDCPQQAKKCRKAFIYGNYDRYYGYRNFSETPEADVRLQAIKGYKEMFAGKHMLDIGCNNGSLTLLITLHCKPASVIGIDIDGDLIGSARKHLLAMLKKCQEKDLVPLKTVEFRRANYVYQDEVLLETEKPQFDVILCLSVTKWIHLNYGDAALKLVFKRVYRQLHAEGIFILEAQPWDSYKRKKKLTEQIYQNFKQIKFRPNEFNDYLTGNEIGFREVTELKVASPMVKGFRRPIYIFRK